MILTQILEHKTLEVCSAKDTVAEIELRQRCADMPACRGFERRLRDLAATSTAIIAEVKKGSPSKGLIREDFDPVQIACGYARAGAACISVLTDAKFFLGSLDYLSAIAAHVPVPLLRKDFVIDPYQIYEARANNADAILLIAAALDTLQLNEFYALARELGLDVLLEVHNADELEMALQTPCPLIGINNRCLKSFVTDLQVTQQLISMIPDARFVVSESGIYTRADIEKLQQWGAGAFLIGESLMREPDYEAKLQELLGCPGI